MRFVPRFQLKIVPQYAGAKVSQETPPVRDIKAPVDMGAQGVLACPFNKMRAKARVPSVFY
jgi:hypothetical protein